MVNQTEHLSDQYFLHFHSLPLKLTYFFRPGFHVLTSPATTH